MMTFSVMIQSLKNFWSGHCAIIEGNIYQVGAATLCPETALKITTKDKWNICQVQRCIRPTDAREGAENNRLSKFFQMQVICKPIPQNFRSIMIDCLRSIGLSTERYDIRFIEDNWKNPSIGATGVGFEIWCNGMEICQFTYMQKIGGIALEKEVVEVTFGLERLALFLQNKNDIFSLTWDKDLLYKDIYDSETENDESFYNFYYNEDDQELKEDFEKYIKKAQNLLEMNKYRIAFEFALKASHILNILDARGILGEKDRTNKLLTIRDIVANILNKI